MPGPSARTAPPKSHPSLRTRIHESVGGRQRDRRWQWLLQAFPDLDQMSVLDLGGALATWQRAPVRAAHVHIVNLTKPPADVPDWAQIEVANACDLPAHFQHRRYDLVFSNSVIEHVGGHERRLRFAETVHRMADAHWVQTPYRYYPIEPHWLFPGLQFLPLIVRARLARRWPLSHTRGKPLTAGINQMLWTELLDRTMMRVYFPSSRLRAERVLGMTKSLIAIRGASAS